MQTRVSITQRAFEIARSGSVSNVQDIRRALQREGYAADFASRARAFQTASRGH